MSKFILKRILALIPVMLGVSLIIFSLLYFTPGDPAEYMLGMDATQEILMRSIMNWDWISRFLYSISIT